MKLANDILIYRKEGQGEKSQYIQKATVYNLLYLVRAAVHIAIVAAGLCSLGSEIGGRGMNSVGIELGDVGKKTVEVQMDRTGQSCSITGRIVFGISRKCSMLKPWN